MSNKRTEASRKAKRKKLAKVEKAKASAAPPKPPKPKPANLQHLENVRRHLTAQIAQLKQDVTKSFSQSHENHLEIKQGLDASEYNLRTHQKVLNALSIEVEKIAGMVNAVTSRLNAMEREAPEGGEGKTYFKDLELDSLKMKDVKLSDENTVRRVDWPFYHQQVDKDLALLAELEEKRRLEREEEERLARVEAAKRAKEKKEREARLNAEPPSEEQPESEFPPLATTFGGDYGSEEASDDEDTQEGGDREHGSPGGGEEDAVSQV